jgi:hypothetical protein
MQANQEVKSELALANEKLFILENKERLKKLWDVSDDAIDALYAEVCEGALEEG